MSLESIKDLLNKQKLVEGMIHSRAMPRQDIVETLVHKQHLATLESLMATLPTGEIGNVLESLPVEDAKLLWERVPEERTNEILWEISGTIREQLAGNREPGFSESQMNAFRLAGGRLRQVTIAGRKDLEGIRTIWIDLLNASKSHSEPWRS